MRLLVITGIKVISETMKQGAGKKIRDHGKWTKFQSVASLHG